MGNKTQKKNRNQGIDQKKVKGERMNKNPTPREGDNDEWEKAMKRLRNKQ